MHSNSRTICGILAVATLAAAVWAQPVNLPSDRVHPVVAASPECGCGVTPIGPVTTPGDATAVFRIAQPGHYRLTKKFTGTTGRSGIVIDADHVVLDLGGHVLVGGRGSADGIRIEGEHRDITIRNGALREWDGVAVSTAGATPARIERVFTALSGSGILASGGTTIERCTAVAHRGGGIAGSSGVILTDCLSQMNAGDGIYVNDGCRVERCVSEFNAGHGYYLDGDAILLQGCVAYLNSLNGFAAIYTARIRDCVAEQNGGHGFWSLDPVQVTECNALVNGGAGFSLFDGSGALNCLAHNNGLHGITITSYGTIRGNRCIGHIGGDGIRLEGEGNRVADNHLAKNAVGVRAIGAANLITGNFSAADGTAFDVAPGNLLGPVTDDLSTGGPHANFRAPR